MCLAFGVERLDELGDKVASVLELQPPQGIGDKLRALGKLKSLADSRAEDRLERPLPGGRARPARPRPPADPHLLAGRRRPVHHAALGLHEGPAHRRPQRRHVPAAEVRRGLARACTGRSTRTPPPTGATAPGAWRSRSRSAATRSRPTPAPAPRPKHVDELMVAGFLRGKPVEIVQCKTVDLQVPARAEIVLEGYCERGELRRRGPVRRPHGLLHARRAVPGAAPDVHDDAPRRDLPEHPGRPAAGRGRLARQGHRAALPARAARDAARARRLRPAGRRRVPQLLHRLDPQGLPGSRAQGHARGLGHGPALADEDGDRRRRVGRRARLRRGRLAGRRERRSGPRRRAGATGRSTSSTTRRRCSRSAASSASTRPRRGPARATRASGPRSRA